MPSCSQTVNHTSPGIQAMDYLLILPQVSLDGYRYSVVVQFSDVQQLLQKLSVSFSPLVQTSWHLSWTLNASLHNITQIYVRTCSMNTQTSQIQSSTTHYNH